MKSHVLSLSAALLLSGGVASAQLASPLSLEIVFDGTPALAATGLSQAEFDGFTVDPSGATIHLFDSISGFDGLLRVTGGTASVFATRNQLAGSSASASDFTAGADHVFINVRGSGGTRHIWAFPHSATDFDTDATRLVAITGPSDEIEAIAADDKNERLILGYNEFQGIGLEKIAHVPYTAEDATPTDLADQATLQAAIATIPGYTDATTNAVDIIDMTVQSDGDIIFSQGFASNHPINGSLLKVTETGTVSVFRTAADIKAAAGVDPGTVNIGSVSVAALPNDEIFIVVTFSSNNATLDPFMAVVSEDGSTQRHVATQNELYGALTPAEQTGIAPSGDSFFFFDFRHNVGVDASENIYFHRQANDRSVATQSAVFRLSGVLDEPTNARDWSLY